MAAQSHLIQIRVPRKSCFWGSFLEKILVLTDFDQMLTPPLYTSLESSAWKLSHGIFWKLFYGFVKASDFLDACAQIFSLILRPCLIHFHSQSFIFVHFIPFYLFWSIFSSSSTVIHFHPCYPLITNFNNFSFSSIFIDFHLLAWSPWKLWSWSSLSL